jgi:hypothetical protein
MTPPATMPARSDIPRRLEVRALVSELFVRIKARGGVAESREAWPLNLFAQLLGQSH